MGAVGNCDTEARVTEARRGVLQPGGESVILVRMGLGRAGPERAFHEGMGLTVRLAERSQARPQNDSW